jgi:hypothetical protein
MPKPDLKEMNARSHEANQKVQVNLNKDRRVTVLSHMLNPQLQIC